MEKGLLVVGLTGLLLGFAPAPPPRPDDPKQQQKLLLGTWVIVRQENAGKPLPTPGVLKAVFVADKVTFTRDGTKTNELTVVVGPKKTMDLKAAGMTYLCIYALDRDVLDVAYQNDVGKKGLRPASLTSTDGRVFRMVLKRERK